jgi:serine/threonine protein kinase
MRPMGDGPHLPERYEWKSQAGKGGMGVVYQVTDRTSGALVALKVLSSRGLVEMARFTQEAKVLAELSHPGIVRYFDHGVTPEGAPYIAMEWLEGETLEDRIARGRLDPIPVACIAQQVLAALSAAHGRDIVHRDIKPGNIFLIGGRLDSVRVLDFGIARRRLDIKRFTREGATVGTPLYTSPEQARGRADVDGRADIFSLGCVLFEALAGEPPFVGDSPLEVMTKVCAGCPSDLALKRPGLPSALVAMVKRMLAADPAGRPQSAAALAGEFGQFLAACPSVGMEASMGRQPPRARPASAATTDARMASVLLASRAWRGKHEDKEFLAEVRRLSVPLSCVTDRLVNRSVLATALASPSPEEQARRLARLALAVRALEPTVKIAIASGRTELHGPMPVGPLMERLPLLMIGQVAGTIRIDETTRRFLVADFELTTAPGPLLLVGEKAVQSEGTSALPDGDVTMTIESLPPRP